MKIRRVRSLSEFRHYCERSHDEQTSLRDFETSLETSPGRKFFVQGFSYPAGREVNFLVDRQYSADGRINWRERVVCPITQLNNRLRASIQLFEMELGPYRDDKIYISEQVTPLYNYLRKLYPNLIGSEFLGFDKQPGTVNDSGVRHEDMTALSFPSGSFDYVLSFDCFEHFSNFRTAFAECARILKTGGKMLWSVPFVSQNERNTIRAEIVDGEVVHRLPPEYHGDPVNSQGCLCFTHFGWEMLDQVKDSDFSDAYAIPYYSREFGYLGPNQLVFVAQR